MVLKRTIVLGLVLAGFVLSAAANPLPSVGCWWEDPTTTVLGFFGTGDPPIIATNVTAPDPVFEGERSLRLEDNSPSGTPQGFLCYIWDLNDGDVVTAWFMRYDDTPTSAPFSTISIDGPTRSRPSDRRSRA